MKYLYARDNEKINYNLGSAFTPLTQFSPQIEPSNASYSFSWVFFPTLVFLIHVSISPFSCSFSRGWFLGGSVRHGWSVFRIKQYLKCIPNVCWTKKLFLFSLFNEKTSLMSPLHVQVGRDLRDHLVQSLHTQTHTPFHNIESPSIIFILCGPSIMCMYISGDKKLTVLRESRCHWMTVSKCKKLFLF